MQNKSAIWIFTILLAVACLYQLSFSWVTSNVENSAKEFAQLKLDSAVTANPSLGVYEQENLKSKFESEYLADQNGKEVYPVLGFTYKYCKKQEINLGLDLQGGMNVTLEVSLVDLIKALSANSDNPTFLKALNRASELQREKAGDYITLFGEAVNEIDPGFKLASVFHNRENQERFPRDFSNDEVLNVIREEAESAISRTEQVLRKRIDNLGVVQPKIQRLSTSGRIIVELPGIKEKERVRKILQGTAKLEFWETYDNRNMFGQLDQINNYLKSLEGLETKGAEANDAAALDSTSTDAVAANDATSTDSTTNDVNELENELASLGLDSTSTDSASTEFSEADFVKDNPLFGKLRPLLNVDQTTQQMFPVEGCRIGYASVTDTAEVLALLNRSDIRKFFGADAGRIKFLWDAKSLDDGDKFYYLNAIKTDRDGLAPLEGDDVANARPSADPAGRPEVSLTMTPDGAKVWKRLTKENVGKAVAIVLDNLVYSAPTVQSEIAGGQSSISGNFTQEEVEDLSNVLKAGKLPAPSKIIEEAVVGPSLGRKSISDGLNSFVIALFIVLLYMWFYYSKAGLVSDIALFANVFFIMGVLTSLGATLTLPGIAGIVLTIGMSVDANVLIYERIREEIRSGKGIKMAIHDGYNAAYSSILDANITTLLTGVVLYIFGSGPIKGFATTLIIGILTSLFAAIFITRLVFEWQMDKNQKLSFSTKMTENLFNNAAFAFIGKRKMFYAISGVIILVGLGSLFTRGLNYGVDFTGGRSYTVLFENPVDVENVRTILGGTFVDENGLKQVPEVKEFGASNQINIITKYMISESGNEVDQVVENKLKEGLDQLNDSYSIERSQKVEATIASDIKQSAVFSVIFALIIIFLYIVFRFRKWQFGLGALVAMFHDVLIVLSVFSLLYGILPFDMEIDQAFIAAILTVVGYSINDTVVVFDRIREYVGLHKKEDQDSVVNKALNSTLSRTINTSLSTFFVLLIIFLFGGEVIRGFVFALMVGIVVGTYSSLCIASPIYVDLMGKEAVPAKK